MSDYPENERAALYTTRLQNTVLTLRENLADSDYSGGSYYYDKGTSITLAYTTFRQEDWNFSRVSVPGMTLSSTPSSPQVRQGTWSVTPRGARMLLVLEDYGGSKRSYAIELSDSGGWARLDGVDWLWQRS